MMDGGHGQAPIIIIGLIGSLGQVDMAVVTMEAMDVVGVQDEVIGEVFATAFEEAAPDLEAVERVWVAEADTEDDNLKNIHSIE